MIMLSSTMGDLLRPIKDSNWLRVACCRMFWKMTSGSSTPLGEEPPVWSEGKAREGLQLVCHSKNTGLKKSEVNEKLHS
jgi:hypothetical protein